MTEDAFLELVPDGWLRRLCDAWREMHMEMPLQFVVLTGMAVVGNVIGYRAWCKVAGDSFVYPNLNALLVSPAGLCRRSAGTSTIISIARSAGIEVYEGKATREGLIDELMESPNVLVYEDEIAEIVSKREHQQSMTVFLPKILLSPPRTIHERTRGGGKVTLHNPMVTCVFTGAPDWFYTQMPKEASGGGFLRRFIKCCLDDRETFYINFNDDTDGGAIKSRLGTDLGDCVRPLQGRLRASDDVNKWIETYYAANEKLLRETPIRWMVPHLSGKPSDLVRIAVVLVAAARETQLSIERLEQAKALIDYYESTLALLHGEIGGSGDYHIEAMVLKMLDGDVTPHGPLIAKVKAATQASVNEIGRVLKGMAEMGTITRVDGAGGRVVWPPVGWRK
jgi:hypothetical protein